MEQHPNDRFVAAMREMMPALRELIPKYFGHAFEPGQDWEERYPGALCIAEFGGKQTRSVLSEVPNREDWWPFAEAKLSAMKDNNADASITQVDPDATPPVYAGGLRNGKLRHGFRSFVSVTGGPQMWDHVVAGGGLMRSQLGDSSFIIWEVHSWRGPGVQRVCEQSELSEDAFNSFVSEVHRLVYR